MKAREENGQITIYPRLPNDWGNILNFRMAPESVHEAQGFYEVAIPVYDSSLQVLGDIYFDAENLIYTYPVIDKTAGQLAQEKEELLQNIENDFDIAGIKRLLAILTRHILEDPGLTGDVLEAVASVHPQYRTGRAYRVGEVFVFEGALYRVVTGHTSQQDWVPSSTPALYARYAPAGQVAAWVQPAGAHDAYGLGARVTHGGRVWESTVEGNVWEPGVYGWTAV